MATRPRVHQPLRLSAGGPDNEYTGLTTDASGFFTVDVSSLVAGAYDWRVKDPKYLANYFDWDVHGTVNFTNNVGIQIGWRPSGAIRCGRSSMTSRPMCSSIGKLYESGTGPPRWNSLKRITPGGASSGR